MERAVVRLIDGTQRPYRRRRITELADALEWERFDDFQMCRISVMREANIDDDDDLLKELQEWMIDRLLAFKRVFGPHLAELVK